MKTEEPKEYIAPQVKIVEVAVEKGFAITGQILNDKYNSVEKHIVDDAVDW